MVAATTRASCGPPSRHACIQDAANDPCAELREPFVQVVEKQREEIARRAEIGATAGALIGGTVAASRRNRNLGTILAGTLIGAAAGAVAVAAIGCYVDLGKRAGTTGRLRNTVFDDARADARAGDQLVHGVARLNECRLRSLTEVAALVQPSPDNRELARARLAEIRRFAGLDTALIARVSQGLKERSAIHGSPLERSGAEDPEAYIAKAEAYRPRVRDTRTRCAARPGAEPIRIPNRNRRGETPVEALLFQAADP